MIVTSGSVSTKWERKFVLQSLKNIGDTTHYADFEKRFQKEFAKFVKSKYAFSTSNGTGALHLALAILGVGKGDEVIIPDMTYISCTNVVEYLGAKPVLVDIDPIKWTLDPKSVANAITKKTKAIMPVWMYGQPPDMSELLKFKIPIVEDSCPAVGSYYKGKHAGTFGEFGCFSFQAAKIMITGEGGMLVTNNKQYDKRARKIADNSESDRQFWFDEIGYMYLMGDVQSALGLGQLYHIKKILERKKEIFMRYYEGLRDIYQMNYFDKDFKPNFWMPSIIVKTEEERFKLRKYLKDNSVDTRPFFYPLSMFGIWKKRFSNKESYNIGLRGINLPGGVRRTNKEIDYICSKIIKYVKS